VTPVAGDPPTHDLDAHLVVERDAFTLDVALQVAAGTTTALLGPNGAGKSTALAAIAGLLPLTAGHVRLGDRILDDPARDVFVRPQERRAGVVFQQYLLFGHLTVLDNVAFGPANRGVSRREARVVAARWLDTLGLTDLADRRPGRLSGGQAQRVALARALAVEPQVLLLDEPLAALDVATRSELRRWLRTHLDTFAGPRIVVTHDPTDAVLLADRIVVVEDGRVTQTGTPEEIRRRPASRFVAALAGTNLLTGTNRGGDISTEPTGFVLHAAHAEHEGAVLVTIHPSTIALYPDEPHGSPRNTWATTVVSVEPAGDTVRVLLGGPLPLAVDVTPAASAALGLRPGNPVWATVKATEVTVSPA
jgi:molybdate transport system ATP-binding protein